MWPQLFWILNFKKKFKEQWVCLGMISLTSSFKSVLRQTNKPAKSLPGLLGVQTTGIQRQSISVFSHTCRASESLKRWIKQASFHFLVYYGPDDLRLSCRLVLILCQCKAARDYVHSCTVQIIPSKWTLQGRSNVCRATCTRKAQGRILNPVSGLLKARPNEITLDWFSC